MGSGECSMLNVQFSLRRPIVGCADEADAGEEKNGSEDKINEDLFDIAHSATGLHKVYGSQDKPGNSEKG
jgi:hypothetical protein